MWEYGEINEISQYMRLLFNAWFSLLTAFVFVCFRDSMDIAYFCQITISATRFRFHSFTVSFCRRVWKGDNLAKMAHFRNPLLFSRTPSPHTGSPGKGCDNKRNGWIYLTQSTDLCVHPRLVLPPTAIPPTCQPDQGGSGLVELGQLEERNCGTSTVALARVRSALEETYLEDFQWKYF